MLLDGSPQIALDRIRTSTKQSVPSLSATRSSSPYRQRKFRDLIA
jgi:hypothetical protein